MSDDVQARWNRRKHARPAELIEAALACFADRGYAATRLEDVAKRAGVTKGTIYLYFRDKEALFQAAVTETLAPNLLELGALAAAAPTASGALESIVLGLAERFANSPAAAIPKVIVSEAGNFPSLAQFYFREVVILGLETIQRVLRRGIAEGEFRPDLNLDHVTLQIVAPVLMGMLWRYTLAAHDPVSGRMDLREMAKTQAEILLQGLAARGGAPQH